ncbi:hypothetical protein SLH49_12500 [Cognatiyoonia sp. IB215446]|uniref:hypothetical protein n=1 Tax=Cognatiyoonia sp. IB215446 TaxID=3097355 RepID=UPI002A0EA58E|nr:hypothetical protein [Cognatiyoonia sp. IB215446]MDX8348800.1 hypothetical protein [Cognatiyoonia sp. IB215446]
MVMRADCATSAKTLAELGIVPIDLTADAKPVELSDGAVTTGHMTFDRDNGAVGAVADVNHVAEASGCWLVRAARLRLGRVLGVGDVPLIWRTV